MYISAKIETPGHVETTTQMAFPPAKLSLEERRIQLNKRVTAIQK
jgi:hypothetical protein